MATVDERLTTLETNYNKIASNYVTNGQQHTVVETLRTDIDALQLRMNALEKALQDIQSVGASAALAANRIGKYTHTQASDATTWSINHNLGSQYVYFVAYDDDDEAITPTTIEYTSENTLTLTFAIAKSGAAKILKVS